MSSLTTFVLIAIPFNFSVLQLNTFQVVIATNGTATYALFLYANIQWITDLSGEATKVGFNKGDGIDYFLPPIANPAALPLTSNVLVPGLYVYRIDGASIPAGPGNCLRRSVLKCLH